MVNRRLVAHNYVDALKRKNRRFLLCANSPVKAFDTFIV